MQFSIYRFNPEVDQKPYFREYHLDTRKVKAVMLLDALKYFKEVDESLSFRRSCGEGVCGSDAMNVNGRNCLACITPLKLLKSPVKIRPLTGMPVIRDLIVDMSQFYAQYEKIKPYLQNSGPIPAREYRQSPKAREKLDGLYECILCGCCSSACPSYWWNPDKFLGPAASLWAARFILDSRDDQTQERLNQLDDAYSIFRCRSIMSCADVCPKDLNPSQAIGHIRHKLLDSGV